MPQTFEQIERTDVWRDLALPAQAFYSDIMEHHNWQHGLATAQESVALAGLWSPPGSDGQLEIAAVAGAWHDAGYHEDHRALGFATKEEYSDRLATEFLTAQGAPQALIDGVSEAIVATTHGVPRTSPLEATVHMADVVNIGRDYGTFLRVSARMFAEAQVFSGNTTDYHKWHAGTLQVLKEIIDEAPADMLNGLLPDDHIAAYLREARRNVRRFATATQAELEASRALTA